MTMQKYDIEKLRDLPIEGVAERLGLQVVRHKALCPFHDDHHASLSFCVRRNSFRCFVCDAHGGTIDLVMRVLGKDFKDACRWLGGSLTPGPSPIGRGLEGAGASPTGGGLEGAYSFDASRYERYFLRPWLSQEARAFLFDERRLDERVVRWCRLTWASAHRRAQEAFLPRKTWGAFRASAFPTAAGARSTTCPC